MRVVAAKVAAKLQDIQPLATSVIVDVCEPLLERVKNCRTPYLSDSYLTAWQQTVRPSSVLDVESFTELFVACYQRCWLVAAAISGDRAEADDIVQEAAMIALRKLADFTVGTNFAAWMSQIVRLTALNHSKKSGRRSTRVTDPAEFDQTVAPDSFGPEHQQLAVSSDGRLAHDQTLFGDEVLSALQTVSESARACLLLRVVGQLSYDEISASLDIPAGTVMSHVHRAKQSLRQYLTPRHQQTIGNSLEPGQE